LGLHAEGDGDVGDGGDDGRVELERRLGPGMVLPRDPGPGEAAEGDTKGGVRRPLAGGTATLKIDDIW